MKHYYAAILLLLFVFSCKKTNEVPAITTNYPETAVGTYKNGSYIVQDSVALGQQWNNALHNAGENYNLQNFKILHTTASGNIKQQCFILTATANKGNVKAAVLLVNKDGKLYFEDSSVSGILCASDCGNGCNPIAVANANSTVVRLVCSSCSTCIKTDVLLIF